MSSFLLKNNLFTMVLTGDNLNGAHQRLISPECSGRTLPYPFGNRSDLKSTCILVFFVRLSRNLHACTVQCSLILTLRDEMKNAEAEMNAKFQPKSNHLCRSRGGHADPPVRSTLYSDVKQRYLILFINLVVHEAGN
jgi:hypothetical protein